MEQTDVRLKLMIDSKGQRVLYGEADKNFIDFLFNLLCLPLGAVISLLKKEAMVGCLRNLYDSLETFNEAYIQPNQSKNRVLKPKLSFICSTSTKLLPYSDDDPPPISSFLDTVRSNNTTPFVFGALPSATSGFSSDTGPFGTRSAAISGCSFGSIGTNVQPPSGSRDASVCGKNESPTTTTYGEKVGFVKSLATYIVMDDLTVKPISEFSIVALFERV